MEWIWIAAVVVILLIIIIRNIRVVQQSQAYVVERLGAFSAVWGVGLHFKVPFLERVAKKASERTARLPVGQARTQARQRRQRSGSVRTGV